MDIFTGIGESPGLTATKLLRELAPEGVKSWVIGSNWKEKSGKTAARNKNTKTSFFIFSTYMISVKQISADSNYTYQIMEPKLL